MPYPYFFCSRTSAGAAFFLLALLPTLSSATEPAESPAPLSMYFDDSQMVEVATRVPKPLRQVAENRAMDQYLARLREQYRDQVKIHPDRLEQAFTGH